MKLSLLTKSILASAIDAAGGISWKLKRYGPRDVLILMYHRVIPGPEVKNWVQPGMYVEPETFKGHIQYLKRHFRIIGLRDIPRDFEKTSADSMERKPTCVLTFDDGWLDFYQYAFPILRGYGVPATVFLPTGFIGGNKWFWTDRLAYLLFQGAKDNGLRRVLDKGKHPLFEDFLRVDGSFETLLERAISKLKNMPRESIEEVIEELAAMLGTGRNLPGRAFLTWEEVREMSKSGLVNFGSHTRNHSILTTLDAEEIGEELQQSREKLIKEQVVDPSYIPFSYPNGDYNDSIVELVREAGFNLAVTTRSGWNSGAYDLHVLNRMPIHQDISSTLPLFGCRIIGLW